MLERQPSTMMAMAQIKLAEMSTQEMMLSQMVLPGRFTPSSLIFGEGGAGGVSTVNEGVAVANTPTSSGQLPAGCQEAIP